MSEQSRHSTAPGAKPRRISPTNARRGRVMTGGVVALAMVVVLGVAAVMLGHDMASSDPGTTATTSSGPTADRGAARSALFVGDSYTVGPSSVPDFGYPCLTATNLGWNCNLGSQPGTGYISGGPDHRLPRVLGALEVASLNASERLPRLRENFDADVVVLDAGRNDLQYGPIYLSNMFLYTVERARETWPRARIVAIAPWFIDDPDVEFDSDEGPVRVGPYLEGKLREVPENAAVTFIDPGALGWFVDEDVSALLADDGIHPNPDGHKRIAEKLTAAMIADGFGQLQ
ncbi:SGNH/GDSL hydrolase family protein [Rhodococcus fascians]|uniref:SGNH/GDSL hydrolase family protein n=1 Tax=Rhodococcoides fascians TaxID=1828 RepID=UPI0024B97E4A|nr:SGNH/GDSL hydrolase family protein [Rhodococcus fascians]MDJ0428047.1 SGNH/GDSL hydrolase family protein [Rhodococcus fascians]